MRLEGSRCAVRPWQLSDADAVVRHANNANVARQLRDRFPHPYSRANALAFLKAALSSGDESNLAILLAEPLHQLFGRQTRAN